jgi:zinc protease
VKSVLRVLCAAALLLGGAAAQAKNLMETSPGGIPYARINIPGSDMVSIRIAWPSDWAFREGVNQAVPFVGADLILAGGAEGYPAGEVTETFADLKAQGGLSPGAGYVFGSLDAPKENLSKALKIANAHLRAPALEQIWLERAKNGLAANISEATSKPDVAMFDAGRWAVLGDTPLRRSLSMDPPEQIASVTRDDVERWYRQTLLRNSAMIAIAGPVSAKEAGRAIDALFAGLPEKALPKASASKADFSPRRILLHVPDSEFSSLAFVAPLPPSRESNDFEDFIILGALGGDDQSVLFDAVRTRLRASYGFGAGLGAYTRDLRFLWLSGQVETAKLGEAEKVVREAYDAFRKAAPTGDLGKRKSPFADSIKANHEIPSAQAFGALLGMIDGLDPAAVRDLKALLDKVSEASIKTRLDKVYPPAERFLVIAVSPDPNALPGACVIKTPAEAVRCR